MLASLEEQEELGVQNCAQESPERAPERYSSCEFKQNSKGIHMFRRIVQIPCEGKRLAFKSNVRLNTPVARKTSAQFHADSKNKNLYATSSFSPRKLHLAHQTVSPESNSTHAGEIKLLFDSHRHRAERKDLYWQGWLMGVKMSHEAMPEPSAQSYCAVMCDTKEFLILGNPDLERQIASLTKIMTAYTVVNLCSQHGIKLSEHSVMIHRQASYMEGTSANLKKDEEVLIIDLLFGLLLPSGNDAGVALAQHFGKFLSFKFAKDSTCIGKAGSIDRFEEQIEFYNSQYQQESVKLFVFEMNKNASVLGLTRTHFVNPTGLSNASNVSTARDMALLTAHCLRNHTLRAIFRKKFHTCEAINSKLGISRQIHWRNTNRHLYEIRECIGVKTGITPSAGPCLSSAYKVGSRELVVIVLSSASLEDRYLDASKIYSWARKKLANY